jgi:hypothetical protein
MRNKKKLLWITPLAIVGMAAFIAIGGLIVMYLWNWLLPALFGWHMIGFWQALGVLVLCRILFGGFGGGMHGRKRGRRIADRWSDMTPEEREQFRQGWRSQFGHGSHAAEGGEKA